MAKAKPMKTFEETLAEEMRDPEFREGFLQAKAEIEAFARKRDSERETRAGPTSRRGSSGRPGASDQSGAVRQALSHPLKAVLERLINPATRAAAKHALEGAGAAESHRFAAFKPIENMQG